MCLLQELKTLSEVLNRLNGLKPIGLKSVDLTKVFMEENSRMVRARQKRHAV